MSLLDDHVQRFNEAVRSGDFSRMLEQFADDAEMSFEGAPAGPFHGREAIAEAYRTQPPDDELDVLSPEEREDGTIVAPYSWHRDEGRRSGEMRLTPRDGKIARLVVAFDN